MAFRFQVKKAYRTLPWPFLLSLGLGILTAIVLLSSKIKWMLDHKPALIWYSIQKCLKLAHHSEIVASLHENALVRRLGNVRNRKIL